MHKSVSRPLCTQTHMESLQRSPDTTAGYIGLVAAWEDKEGRAGNGQKVEGRDQHQFLDPPLNTRHVCLSDQCVSVIFDAPLLKNFIILRGSDCVTDCVASSTYVRDNRRYQTSPTPLCTCKTRSICADLYVLAKRAVEVVAFVSTLSTYHIADSVKKK